jgi:hypothetical protein
MAGLRLQFERRVFVRTARYRLSRWDRVRPSRHEANKLSALSMAMTTVGGSWSLIGFALAIPAIVLVVVGYAARISWLNSPWAGVAKYVPAAMAWGIASLRMHQGKVLRRAADASATVDDHVAGA